MVDDEATTAPPPRARRLEAPGERWSRGSSYEAGESSATGSMFSGSTADGTIMSFGEDLSRGTPAPPSRDAGEAGGVGGPLREPRSHARHHKHRSSGAFLLQDTIDDAAAVAERDQHGHRRRQSRYLQPGSGKGKGAARSSDQSRSSGSRDVGLGIDDQRALRGATASPEPEPSATTLSVSKRAAASAKGAAAQAAPSPSRNGPAPLDVDSAQIVNMALNLSESRRIASRRNVSQPTPPRLAPLPDTSTSGSLRQHLQQQRKISRTVSPRPDRGVMPRTASGQRVSSPLQGSFDFAQEGGYRYHFTQSTLARAQKAKEHLELMAQYRRLLELVPPIQPNGRATLKAVSPPSSPTVVTRASTASSSEANLKLGRQYNPLQYIRNRKVRARERNGIDGDSQGFGDVVKVTEWVDNVAKWAATGQSVNNSGVSLPPFGEAEDDALQRSPPSAVGGNKPKRPRVDWVVDPADIIADVHWLEQGQNRQLIEDRHWHRIFPQTVEAVRPATRQTPDVLIVTPPQAVKQETDELDRVDEPKVPKLAKTETEHSHSSARERARQKLQDLKGLHHRHNSSVHSHHDFLRRRRGSTSDLSDSENEGKDRRVRSGTISSSGRDILEKQMMEMIAKEARENELQGISEHGSSYRPPPPALFTPERNRDGVSRPTSGMHSRQGSFVDASESDEKSNVDSRRRGSPKRHRPGRASLDVPPQLARRGSVDGDSSQPNSPDLRATRESIFVPSIGMDLTPPTSRPGSPSRNPFTKVKHIFHDHSRERGSDSHPDEKEYAADIGVEPNRTASEPIDTPQRRKPSPERRGSRSPTRKIASKLTGEYKTHSRIGSIGLRGEERGGVRGLFKGARIDTVIRGGVTKLSEILWRKDPSVGDGLSEGTSTDDSGDEVRGRRRGSIMMSRRSSRRGRDELQHPNVKNYLDVMPTFHSASEQNVPPTGENGGIITKPSSRTHSRAGSRFSTRFDRLKPPRIDVQNASPASSPPDAVKRPPSKARDSDFSDTDSRTASSYIDGVRVADARLNTIISMPPSFASSARHRSSLSQRDQHWSISDRSPSPDRAPLSKREVARLRALILSSGIKAMEISRRVNEPRLIFAPTPDSDSDSDTGRALTSPALRWPDIAALSPNASALRRRAVAPTDAFAVSAHSLGASIQTSGQRWQAAADHLETETAPSLERGVDAVRTRLQIDLTQMTRAAADEADETSRDLALSQRLKIKRVVDVIEKMLRRRRRRFRWVRRGLWLAVEWALVGVMWYVWFVVMIFRVFWGIGQGAVRGVRWLLWL